VQARVIGQSLRVALAGVGLGTLIAWLAGRSVEPLLFRQPATDPRVYAGVGIAVLLVAAAASARPALRAAATDPSAALRSE
jgi:ABC-type antimicrobial peptide transport system permease subunit